jgi:hypothetical protein
MGGVYWVGRRRRTFPQHLPGRKGSMKKAQPKRLCHE